MNKKIVLSVCAITAFMSMYSMLPKSVASSTAITVSDIQNKKINEIEVNFPTIRPFQSMQLLQIQIGVSPSPTATSQPKSPAVKSATVSQTATKSSFADQVITLVNKERAKNGLGSLTKNSALSASAQKYAQDMATQNFFSHTGKDGSTFASRNKAAGYSGYRWMGENIAAGQSSPQSVMSTWMSSSGHKANILNASAKEIGVGYAVNKSATYKYYWVQEFGAR